MKAKLFQASTSEVYGDPTIHPQPEHDWGNVNPIGPRSCYDGDYFGSLAAGEPGRRIGGAGVEESLQVAAIRSAAGGMMTKDRHGAIDGFTGSRHADHQDLIDFVIGIPRHQAMIRLLYGDARAKAALRGAAEDAAAGGGGCGYVRRCSA